MAKIAVLLLGLALVLAFGCQQKAELPKVDIGIERETIKTVLDNYISSIENEDMAAYGLVMAHDPQMINFGVSGDPIVGWDSLKKVIEDQNAALSQTTIVATDVSVHVAPSGELAWATSLWTFKAVMGDKAIELPVRCTWVLEKQADGWVIVHFHKSIATG